MDKSQRWRISIGIKIFSIATSMLGLMLLVVYVSSNRLRKVNQEITGLADYTIPITNFVAKINVHALEQERHSERVLKLYEIEPLNLERIEEEKRLFEQRGDRVDEELAEAIHLVDQAATQAQISTNRQKWTQIKPILEQIEAEHQEFHDQTLAVFELLAASKFEEAHQLEAGLDSEADQFNQEIGDVFLELEEFTVEAAAAAEGHQEAVQRLSRVVATFATAFGLLSASVVTAGLVKPVRRLTQSTQVIRQGNLDAQVEVTTRDEIGSLARSFNTMVDELRLKKKLEDTFGKYVDPRVVKSLMAQSEGAHTEGERQVMTVFFSDIDGFSAITDTLTPDELVEVTNQYLTLMSAPISDYSGVIDKFIRTMVMGFWGPPFTGETNHAQLACCAALEQIARLGKLCQLMAEAAGKTVQVPIKLHIGIATGSLVVGNMGSAAAKSYTVMGDTVNTASRLKGVSKQYGTQVILAEETYQMAAEAVEVREVDLIQVVGKQEPVRVYELLGRKGEISENAIALRDSFEEGLKAYRQQDWEEAQQCFEKCLHINGTDGPADLYLQRVQTLRESPPAPDWDGVWRLTKK
ncbi:MAG: HAMP domain-containing protein [Symploca sp. SIO2E6]|nr:HAMP domain-containing protein [Symploca sp. SIO2E6]